MKTITVVFEEGGKSYAYLTDDDNIKARDAVVVDGMYGYAVAQVISAEETVESIQKATKWIVCRVDDEPYKARIQREKEKAILKAKLERAVKAAREQVDYQELAKINPEIGSLAEELQKL